MAESTKTEKLDQTGEAYKLSDTVKFKASYPKEYSRPKHMKEGQVYTLHRLHAERLQNKGIGKIV